MMRRPPSSTRTDTPFPSPPLFRSGFGALKGLIGATLLFLAANIVYDFLYTSRGARPDWMLDSRTYPLLNASCRAIVDFVETRRSRSEEHTSELQSLMRISYAVFCLKKKNDINLKLTL